jgi:hypothetical protein
VPLAQRASPPPITQQYAHGAEQLSPDWEELHDPVPEQLYVRVYSQGDFPSGPPHVLISLFAGHPHVEHSSTSTGKPWTVLQILGFVAEQLPRGVSSKQTVGIPVHIPFAPQVSPAMQPQVEQESISVGCPLTNVQNSPLITVEHWLTGVPSEHAAEQVPPAVQTWPLGQPHIEHVSVNCPPPGGQYFGLVVLQVSRAVPSEQVVVPPPQPGEPE